MGKGEQKTDKPDNLLPVPGDVEKGAKSKPAFHIFYTSSPKGTAAVKFSVCILLLIILVLVISLAVVASRVPEPLLVKLTCPDDWVGYRGKCYYFSEAEETWDSSRSHCSALGASLAGIDTLQDLVFLMRHKGRDYHWIGLRREDEAQPWKWANGTEFNNLFHVTEGENCAYLNDVAVYSSKCSSMKKWVCSKPSLHLRKE
uniref:C-type lectin domain family 2 member D-like n=1 Tax=Pelodiscus sinensis TaxID=13735 RepID=K7G257_PELSI|nr:C-type lectin domain family 2 member D-like [Pelodiscus sinensis]|eukprot:XP_025039577.1 C-type lectin domain family 2 member D-like [Pelodiscus sinensis]